MYDLLHGMRIVEMAAFIAGPSCGLHLAQWGAEVIRIDPVSGQRYLTPGFAATLPADLRRAPTAAAALGRGTDEVLANIVGLSAADIGRLHDAGLVASA